MPDRPPKVFVVAGSGPALSRAEELCREHALPLSIIDASSLLTFPSLSGRDLADALQRQIGGDDLPFMLVFPVSPCASEAAARLAQRLSCAFLPGIIGPLQWNEGRLGGLRRIMNGRGFEQVESLGGSAIVTIAGQQTPEPLVVESNLPAILDSSIRMLAIERMTPARGIALSNARVIVAGGAGMGGSEGFVLLREFASKIGAAVGASRSAVMQGWADPSIQIGLSGKVVYPDIYIACGISGSIQHQAGMGGARYIVAINNNRNAPIFQIAHLGIVGDIFSILPCLSRVAQW